MSIKAIGDDLIRGEVRTLRFTYTDSNGDAVNMVGSTFELTIRANTEDTAVVTKAHGDFDISSIATGIVKVTLTAADNAREGTWLFLLWTIFASADAKGQYFSAPYQDKG